MTDGLYVCMCVRLTIMRCLPSDSDPTLPFHYISFSMLHQYGRTALINAAHGGHKETVMSLLDRGADISYKDNVSYCDACMIVLLHYGTVS